LLRLTLDRISSKALFQPILNDLHCLAGRLPCGCRALLRSLNGYLEHFSRKLGLHREVILNLAERLVSTGQVRGFRNPASSTSRCFSATD